MMFCIINYFIFLIQYNRFSITQKKSIAANAYRVTESVKIKTAFCKILLSCLKKLNIYDYFLLGEAMKLLLLLYVSKNYRL